MFISCTLEADSLEVTGGLLLIKGNENFRLYLQWVLSKSISTLSQVFFFFFFPSSAVSKSLIVICIRTEYRHQLLSTVVQ